LDVCSRKVSLAAESFTENVERFCVWAEGDVHTLVEGRLHLITLMSSIPWIEGAGGNSPLFTVCSAHSLKVGRRLCSRLSPNRPQPFASPVPGRCAKPHEKAASSRAHSKALRAARPSHSMPTPRIHAWLPFAQPRHNPTKTPRASALECARLDAALLLVFQSRVETLDRDGPAVIERNRPPEGHGGDRRTGTRGFGYPA